jgi:hypothetical protein
MGNFMNGRLGRQLIVDIGLKNVGMGTGMCICGGEDHGGASIRGVAGHTCQGHIMIAKKSFCNIANPTLQGLPIQ